MRFLRVGDPGSERPVVEECGTTYDLSPITEDIDGSFLATDPVGETRRALDSDRLSPMDISHDRLGPPISRPHAVWCVGMNYAAHAAESGTQPPEAPILFLKTPNTITGPNDDLLIPRGSAKTDWEVELAVIIGRRARYLTSPSSAREHIAGYSISNDISERTWQLETSGGQWSQGKCGETFNPLGPALVPPHEVDASDLRIRSWVNGETRQDSTTNDLIFSVEHLIWHVSQVSVLEPGDVINTGTPAGVALSGRFPYLKPGDVVETAIEGLGVQRQTLRQA